MEGKREGCLDRFLNGQKACEERWCEAEDWCKFHPDYKGEEDGT